MLKVVVHLAKFESLERSQHLGKAKKEFGEKNGTIFMPPLDMRSFLFIF